VANRAIQFLLQRAGSVYSTGTVVQNALVVCESLATKGISSTVCYWNAPADPPRRVLDSYLRVLHLTRDLPADCYLSVKAPAIGFDTGLLKEVLHEARRTGMPVHFDSMAPNTVDRTFALIEKAHAIYPNIGCTLPARWRRSLGDVDRVIDLSLRVRIVKGQWSGLNADETSSSEGFVRVADRLAAKGGRHVAVATHNPKAAANALAELKTSGISSELELLHGLPQRRMFKVAREHNVPVRVYVPWGHAGLPYRLKELGRDPRILMWFLRDLVRA
jgi:proline dehydrogenase